MTTPNADSVCARLLELGWFKYVAPSELDGVRVRFREAYEKTPSILAPEEDVTSANGRYIGARGIDHRSCFADPEELAEGGVSSVFLLLRESFAAEGVLFRDLSDDTDDGYTLVVDGTRYVLFDSPDYGWGEIVDRTVALANDLLAKAGSRERLYSFVAQGNDGWMILLSPELAAYAETLPISPQLDVVSKSSHL